MQLDIHGSGKRKQTTNQTKTKQPNQNNRSLLIQSGLMIVVRNRSDNLLPRKPQSWQNCCPSTQVQFLVISFVFCCNEFRPAGFKMYNKEAEIWKSHCFVEGSLAQKAMKKQIRKAGDGATLIMCCQLEADYFNLNFESERSHCYHFCGYLHFSPAIQS